MDEAATRLESCPAQGRKELKPAWEDPVSPPSLTSTWAWTVGVTTEVCPCRSRSSVMVSVLSLWSPLHLLPQNAPGNSPALLQLL